MDIFSLWYVELVAMATQIGVSGSRLFWEPSIWLCKPIYVYIHKVYLGYLLDGAKLHKIYME